MERLASNSFFFAILPKTNRENRHFLVGADNFLKLRETYALLNVKAEAIAHTIMEQMIVRLGVPSVTI